MQFWLRVVGTMYAVNLTDKSTLGRLITFRRSYDPGLFLTLLNYYSPICKYI